ncbi:MAG: SpoIVB peptidase S55 domain-containing protein [Candidatus Eisenbacteria bacterium]
MRVAARMHLLGCLACGILPCIWGPAAALDSQTPIFPLAEVRPGLRAIALTVLEGTEPDTVALEILGVVENTAPGSHLILVRGLDKPFERIGIAAGMSGSPIYVEGRLLGALAFSFVAATEPLGGATPIEEMLARLGDTFEAAEHPIGTEVRGSLGSLDLPAYPVWRDQWVGNVACAGAISQAGVPHDLPAGLEPIGMPLFFGGALGGRVRRDISGWRALGLDAVAAGEAWSAVAAGLGDSRAEAAETTAGAGADGRGTLKPGDAFGIRLIGGDMEMAAIGTVTWIEGDRLLALGHPFFETAPAEFPVSRARIHTIIPTRGVSFKVGSPLEEVGRLIGDRRCGVSALLGRRARLIPFTVRVRSDGRAQADEYRFDVARNDMLTPGLLYMALQAALTGDIHGSGPATLEAELQVNLEDGRVLRRRDLFVTLDPGQSAANVLAPVAYLAGSSLAPFSIQSVSVQVESRTEVRTARVEAVHVPWNKVRPGAAVAVDIVLRHQEGERETRRVVLHVPESFRGDRIQVMAGSADAFFEWDQERAPQKYAPRDFDQLIDLLENYPSSESLIVRLYGASRGVVHRGRELASLPLSKWQALRGGTTGGDTWSVGGLVVDEQIIATGEVVQGGQMVELQVEE